MKKLHFHCVMTGIVISAAHALPVMATPDANSEFGQTCEIMLIESLEENGEAIAAQAATFQPADAFIESVYDEADGNVETVDGVKIRGVLCQRDNVIPSLRDFPIVATGIPLSISTDFDAPGTPHVLVYYRNGRFQHHYAGDEMSLGNAEKLADVMEVFNMQSHNLPDGDASVETSTPEKKSSVKTSSVNTSSDKADAKLKLRD